MRGVFENLQLEQCGFSNRKAMYLCIIDILPRVKQSQLPLQRWVITFQSQVPLLTYVSAGHLSVRGHTYPASRVAAQRCNHPPENSMNLSTSGSASNSSSAMILSALSRCGCWWWFANSSSDDQLCFVSSWVRWNAEEDRLTFQSTWK